MTLPVPPIVAGVTEGLAYLTLARPAIRRTPAGDPE